LRIIKFFKLKYMIIKNIDIKGKINKKNRQIIIPKIITFLEIINSSNFK
jgi:hypothetical protein